jgi:predicted PolB exonuclease-like 3'-5' exonuclease
MQLLIVIHGWSKTESRVTNLFPEIEQDEHFVVHILQNGTNYQLEVPEYTSLLYKLGPYHFVNTKQTVYVDHYTSMSKAMNVLFTGRLRIPNKTEIHHVDFITWNIKKMHQREQFRGHNRTLHPNSLVGTRKQISS